MADENEKKDSSTVGKINNAVGKGRDLQRAYGAYKKARLAVAAGEGLAGAVPVAIAVIVLVVIVVLFGGAAGVNGGDLSNSSPSPYPYSSGGISNLGLPPTREEFSQLFNIYTCKTALPEYPPPTSSCQTVLAGTPEYEMVYDALSIALKSQQYKTLLTGGGKLNVYIRPSLASGGTGGAAWDTKTIQYWGYMQDRGKLFNNISIVHETIHMIQQRHPELKFPLSQLSGNDKSCYYNSGTSNAYINTYANKTNGVGGGPVSESMAEVGAMNVFAGPGITYSKGLTCYYPPATPNSQYDRPYPNCSIPITSYPTTCPATYDWVRKNIYGVDFFGLP